MWAALGSSVEVGSSRNMMGGSWMRAEGPHELQELVPAQLLVEPRGLREHPGDPLHVVRLLPDVVSLHGGRAPAGLDYAVQEADDCRLPRPVGTQKAEGLPLVNSEV